MECRRSEAQRIRRAVQGLLAAAGLAALAVVVTLFSAGMVVVNRLSRGLPDVSLLRSYEPPQTTRVYSADGRLIATLYAENRTWTPLEEISPWLKKALLASEDARFYQHRGVDPVGVVRAALDLMRSGKIRQGASTITMQLARNLFLVPETSFRRKVREALLALRIEREFTKDEILELYLNQVYFGAGAYGVQAAASRYFDKPASDLTPAEAALIAGLPAAPSEYSPLVDEKAARKRQILVLGRMAERGILSGPQHRQALQEARKMAFVDRRKGEPMLLKVPYFTTYVLKELYRRYGEDVLLRGGLQIYTTVDLDLQRKAEEVVRRQVSEKREAGWGVSNGALVCLENGTGYVRAMVGGLGWNQHNQFNRAWQARRQPGSAFKIFVYTAAIESGYRPTDVVPDTPVTYRLGPGQAWSPRNADGGFMGAIPLRTALQYSRNVVAVKLMTMLGPRRVLETCYRMGLKERIEPHLSTALGSAVVTPLEMAGAVSVLANRGVRIEPTAIKVIFDRDGRVVEDHRMPRKQEVLSESTALIMTELLRNVVEAGTGYRARLEGRPAAGKTGTTDDYRDAWFVGYTPQYTTAVWVGNDDYKPMNVVYGGDLPAPIWKQFMEYAHRGKPVIPFESPEGRPVSVLMCSQSGQRAGPECLSTYRLEFPPHKIPRNFCRSHGKPPVLAVAKPRRETTPQPTARRAPVPGDGEVAPTPIPVEAAASALTPVPEPVDLPLWEGAESPPPEPSVVELPPPDLPVIAPPVPIDPLVPPDLETTAPPP